MPTLHFDPEDGESKYKIESDQFNVTLFRAVKTDKEPKGAAAPGYGVWAPVGYFRDLTHVAHHLAREGFNAVPGTLEEAIETWQGVARPFLQAVEEAVRSGRPLPKWASKVTTDTTKKKHQPVQRKKAKTKIKFGRPKP